MIVSAPVRERGRTVREAVRRIEADANRSADTHLHVFPLPKRAPVSGSTRGSPRATRSVTGTTRCSRRSSLTARRETRHSNGCGPPSRDDGARRADEPAIPAVAAGAARDARRRHPDRHDRRTGAAMSAGPGPEHWRAAALLAATAPPIRGPAGGASTVRRSAGCDTETRSGPSGSMARRHPSPRRVMDRPSTSTSTDRASSSPSHRPRAWSRQPLTPPQASPAHRCWSLRCRGG